MRRESFAFAVSGVFFGLTVGWMLGSQYATPGPAPAPAPEAPRAASAAAPPLDEARVRALRAAADRDPEEVAARVQLGNLYFDSARYEDAIRWYEDALRLTPRDVDVSTDLGVSYYYANQPEKALEQFDYSLSLDPTHTKTMFNVGIVRAFGRQDLDGAAAAWRRLLEVAPDSDEGRAARQALESLEAAHPGVTGAPSSQGPSD